MAQRIAWAFLGRRETNSALKRRSCMQRLMSFVQCAWTTRIALPRWRLWFRTDARSTVFPCFLLRDVESSRSVLKPEVKKWQLHSTLLCCVFVFVVELMHTWTNYVDFITTCKPNSCLSCLASFAKHLWCQYVLEARWGEGFELLSG